MVTLVVVGRRLKRSPSYLHLSGWSRVLWYVLVHLKSEFASVRRANILNRASGSLSVRTALPAVAVGTALPSKRVCQPW